VYGPVPAPEAPEDPGDDLVEALADDCVVEDRADDCAEERVRERAEDPSED
jgi:hypothetical protein